MTSSYAALRPWMCVLLLAGCTSPVPSDPDSGAEPEPDGGTAPPDGGTTPADSGHAEPDAFVASDAGPPPSDEFIAIYDTIITSNCGGESCHLPGTNESDYFGYAPRLQMPDATTARAVLVNQPTDCQFSASSRTRVVPFDPEASAIMIAAEDGLCGRRHNIVVPPTFTATELGRIESWIEGGAL